MLNEQSMFTARDETTAAAGGGGELRSRGSFSSRNFNPQFGDDGTPGASCGEKRGWQRLKASRLGVLCKRKACVLGIVAFLILATMGVAIPLENVNIEIVSVGCEI
jgi:hypothetical protein